MTTAAMLACAAPVVMEAQDAAVDLSAVDATTIDSNVDRRGAARDAFYSTLFANEKESVVRAFVKRYDQDDLDKLFDDMDLEDLDEFSTKYDLDDVATMINMNASSSKEEWESNDFYDDLFEGEDSDDVDAFKAKWDDDDLDEYFDNYDSEEQRQFVDKYQLEDVDNFLGWADSDSGEDSSYDRDDFYEQLYEGEDSDDVGYFKKEWEEDEGREILEYINQMSDDERKEFFAEYDLEDILNFVDYMNDSSESEESYEWDSSDESDDSYEYKYFQDSYDWDE